ncbi:MAG: hypothetical protein JWQ28_788 [Pedobacter sp.]|jgi:hypothetical protein|nr:hypothetical protein [Pedobacter sp.]
MINVKVTIYPGQVFGDSKDNTLYILLKSKNMDTIKKFDLMQKIVNELVDLQHSQQALIQKLGKIEVDNMDLSDSRLEKDLPDMHQRVSDNLDTIGGILEYFAEKTQNFGDKNHVEELKEQKTIDDLKL